MISQYIVERTEMVKMFIKDCFRFNFLFRQAIVTFIILGIAAYFLPVWGYFIVFAFSMYLLMWNWKYLRGEEKRDKGL